MPEPMLRCLVLPPDAGFHEWTPLDVVPAPARDGLAEFVNELVGGYFEVVRGPEGAWLYLNTDGKGLGLRENYVATSVAHEAGLSLADYIAGQVVVLGEPNDEGWDQSVPEDFLDYLVSRGCKVNR